MKLPVNYEKLDWKERKSVREAYVKEQGGVCYFCKTPLCHTPTSIRGKYKINWKLFPSNFLKYPVHLHHCHNTGMTLGAVHSYCNAVLWQYYGE